MKLEYLRLRRSKQFDPVIVEFVSDQINEIYVSYNYIYFNTQCNYTCTACHTANSLMEVHMLQG